MRCSASGDGEREGGSDEQRYSLSTGPAVGGGGLSGRAVAPGDELVTWWGVWVHGLL